MKSYYDDCKLLGASLDHVLHELYSIWDADDVEQTPFSPHGYHAKLYTTMDMHLRDIGEIIDNFNRCRMYLTKDQTRSIEHHKINHEDLGLFIYNRS